MPELKEAIEVLQELRGMLAGAEALTPIGERNLNAYESAIYYPGLPDGVFLWGGKR